MSSLPTRSMGRLAKKCLTTSGTGPALRVSRSGSDPTSARALPPLARLGIGISKLSSLRPYVATILPWFSRPMGSTRSTNSFATAKAVEMKKVETSKSCSYPMELKGGPGTDRSSFCVCTIRADIRVCAHAPDYGRNQIRQRVGGYSSTTWLGGTPIRSASASSRSDTIRSAIPSAAWVSHIEVCEPSE